MDINFPCKFEELTDHKMIMYTIIYNWTLNFKTPFLQGMEATWNKVNYYYYTHY